MVVFLLNFGNTNRYALMSLDKFRKLQKKIINFLINQLLAVPLMTHPVICALLTKTTA